MMNLDLADVFMLGSNSTSIGLFVQRTGQKGPWGTDICPNTVGFRHYKLFVNFSTFKTSTARTSWHGFAFKRIFLSSVSAFSTCTVR